MTKKTSEKRKEAFFAALAETGNQTISAERARVSRSWVTLHRSTDPEFKARMEAAISEARVRLSAADAVKTSAKWSSINGEELVLRGSRGRRAQVSRARLKQWTARGEQRFLSVLSATCNVVMACEAVGLSVQSAYMHAQRWPCFARAWDAAVADGFDALELAMLENARRSFRPEEVDYPPDIPITPMTSEQGLALLNMNRARASGVGRLPGNTRLRATEEETNAAFRKGLRALQLRHQRRG